MQACCRSLLRLEDVGLSFDYFSILYKRDLTDLPRIDQLVIDDCLWSETSFSALIDALSDPTHSLAESLQVLKVRISNFEPVVDCSFARMLASNRRLVWFRFVGSGITEPTVGETNGVFLDRIKRRLTVRKKAAFLSCLDLVQEPL